MMHVGPPDARERSCPPGIRWDSPIATATLQALLDRAVADYGERPALEYRDRRLSYREPGNQVARAAPAFRHIGIGEGADRGGACAHPVFNAPCGTTCAPS